LSLIGPHHPLSRSEAMSDHYIKCSFPGCNKASRKVALCGSHYAQQRLGKTLTPLHQNKRPNNSPPRIVCDEAACSRRDLSGPCHVFRGRKGSGGYGVVRYEGRYQPVHRICWMRECGPIDEGLFIDHQCRNRACCNVDHLRVVTPQVNATENIVDAHWQLNAAKTHCIRNHEFDEENTYIAKSGKRMCRKCLSIRDKFYKSQRRKKPNG